MKKSLLVAVLFAFFGLNAAAQSNTQTVYLKNGSVVTGFVLEEVPGKTIKMKTKDGNIFVYNMEDVERITHEEKKSDDQADQTGHKGLDFGVDMGVNIGTKGGGTSPFVGLTLGKRFTKNFFWGIGAGVDIPTGDTEVMLPFTTDFRIYIPINGTKITPYMHLSTGFVLNLADDVEYSVGYGKWSKKQTIEMPNYVPIQIMPSVMIPLSGKVDFNLGIGYTHYIAVGGSEGSNGSSGAVSIAAKFGFHQGPTNRNRRPKVPTRDRGFSLTIEQQDVTPWNLNADDKYSALGGAVVLGYKWNKNISFGLGYAGSYFTNNAKGEVYSVINSTGDRSLYNDDWAEEIYGAQHKIFLRGEYRLNDNKFSPMASVDLGWRIYKETSEYYFDAYDKEGNLGAGSAFFITPAIGASLRTTNNSYLTLKVGYEIAPAFKEKVFNSDTYRNSYSGYWHKENVLKKHSTSGLFLSLGWTHTFKLGEKLFK